MLFPEENAMGITAKELAKKLNLSAAVLSHHRAYRSVHGGFNSWHAQTDTLWQDHKSPSVVQKYHCAATDHSCTRKQSGLTCRSALPSFLTIFALSADVTPRHRVVPEECICSFQGSEIRSCLAPDMYKFIGGRCKILGTGIGDLLLRL